MSNLLAYIDPMSGMLIIQLIIGGIVGMLAFFRHTIFGGLFRLFGRKKNHPWRRREKPNRGSADERPAS